MVTETAPALTYPLRHARARDVLAGLAVAGLILPEAIAYAGIAGLPASAGLTAAIVGGLAYLLLGKSKAAIVSPTSSAAAVLAASIAALPTASTGVAGAAAGLTLMVGLIFLALSLAQLGSLAGFISRPVLRGFAFGLAITIIVGQLPHIAGVPASGGRVWQVFGALASQLSQFNWPSLFSGLIALGCLLGLRKMPAVPAALVVLVGGMAATQWLGLERLGVATSAAVTLGAPDPGAVFSGMGDVSEMARLAVPVALILFAESWGTIRNLSLRNGEKVAANRELAALGLANVVSGLAQGMPVGAGFSAGSANEAAGATSRLAATVACCAILATLLLVPGVVTRIPAPLLSAIVIGALLHALSPAPLRHLLELRRDYLISIAAALGVLVFGVLDGMLIAVVLSVASLLRRLARPHISVLGESRQGSHDYVDIAMHEDAKAVQEIGIYRPNAPLFFANAEDTLDAILKLASTQQSRCVILSLEESDDLDSTAIDALQEFETALCADGHRLLIARLHDRARCGLHLAGSSLADVATFSVADAVDLARNMDEARPYGQDFSARRRVGNELESRDSGNGMKGDRS